MIYHQITTLLGILKAARETISNFCKMNNLPNIPVSFREIMGADAGFDKLNIVIYISPGWINRLQKYTEERAVYEYSRVIRHELEHYVDHYTTIKITRKYAEKKADKVSIINAVENLSKYNSGEINPKQRKTINPVSNLYESFHGNPPMKKVKVYYEAPEGEEIIKIGRLLRIDYKPETNSKYEGTHFTHESGDLGHKTIKSNAILATNKSGTQLYIVKEKKGKYPKFSERGILG